MQNVESMELTFLMLTNENNQQLILHNCLNRSEEFQSSNKYGQGRTGIMLMELQQMSGKTTSVPVFQRTMNNEVLKQ